MAEQSNKKQQSVIIGGCILVAVIILVIVIISSSISAQIGGYNDSYFVSDNTKYVITYDEELNDADNPSGYAPVKSHLVYYYNGDVITDMKAFYDYGSETTAKSVYDYYKDAGDGNFKEITVSGKYLIITANKSEYSDYTASDIKNQIEFNESLKKANENSESTEGTNTNTNAIDSANNDTTTEPIDEPTNN